MKNKILVAVLALGLPLLLLGLSTSLGNMRAHQVACGDTATPVTDGYPASSMLLWNNSATPVYLGASNVNTSTRGFPICTDTASCLRADMPLDGKYLYCIVGAGSVTLTVLAGAQ